MSYERITYDLHECNCGKGRQFSTFRENDFMERDSETCFCSCKECVEKGAKYQNSDSFRYACALGKDSYERIVYVNDNEIEKLHEEYSNMRK